MELWGRKAGYAVAMKKLAVKALGMGIAFGLVFSPAPTYAEEVGNITDSGAIGAPAVETMKKWYEGNRVVAHALGSVDGKTETNSKEAFLESYEKGFKVFEADFSLTSDGTLVVRHDFDQDSYYTLEQVVLNGNTAMDINRYKSLKIAFKYTPLTAAELLQLMDEYPDIYLITDSKDTDPAAVKRDFSLLVADAQRLGITNVLDRIVVQIYNDDMYHAVKEVYPFQNFIYTLYQLNNPDYDQIGNFCIENNIDVVTFNFDIVEKANIKALTDRGLKVFCHTVNRLLDVQKTIQFGGYGVYTDSIAPQDLYYIGFYEKNNTIDKFFIDGRQSSVESYTIGGKKYYSLRAIAKLLADTEGSFNMVVDDTKKTVSVFPNQEYLPVGGELAFTDGFAVPKFNRYILQRQDVPITNIEGYQVGDAFCYTMEDIGNILGLSITWNPVYGANEIRFQAE